MKRTVRVTIEREFDIDIPDHLLTEDYLEAFERGIFPISYVDDPDTKVEGLFKYVARQRAYGNDYIEGVGFVGEEHMRDCYNVDDFILASESYDDCDVTVLASFKEMMND